MLYFVFCKPTHFLCPISFLSPTPFFFPHNPLSFSSKNLDQLISISHVSLNPPHSIFIHSPLSLLICIHLSPCVQWRASGWSGGHGQDAASLVIRAPRRGRDAAARRRMAGPNVRAPIRRAETAPTLRVVVRLTNECLVFTLTCSQMPLYKHGTCIINRHLHGLL